ncbi:hypothetical protein RJ640_002096 [Escallonia rubra]|uniref:TPX2 C-terminal domain-containing protein n=1 Tax=Escallonia rubra TaxID=112253 RepID=A0AA88UG64_9ASTE|nr:hypothetical protein RJ640_002096 [Escallonia rubra]
MDLKGKNAGPVTPAKDPQAKITKHLENFNPNVKSPALKHSNSPSIKSATKTLNSVSRNPKLASPPPARNKIRERKFVVAKKKSKKEKENLSTVTCKCEVSSKSHKCRCVAYETLRASQEEFFKNRGGIDDQNPNRAEIAVEEEEEMRPMMENPKISMGCDRDIGEDEGLVKNGLDGGDQGEVDSPCDVGSTNVKRRRDRLLEEARECVPDTGSGRVMHLVQAFEKLLSIPKMKDSDQTDEKELEDTKKGMKWALPGLQQPPPRAPETQVSSSSFCPSDFFLTSESLGLDFRVSSSLDSSQGRLVFETLVECSICLHFTFLSSPDLGCFSGSFQALVHQIGPLAVVGGADEMYSSDSTGTFGGRHGKRRQLKITCQKPFKLRTEQRGMSKEEELFKKVQQMMIEEEKQRIPVAQGLPWTTDEPECLAKPPVKESTRPVDLVLHSDMRAAERAEFDHQVAEKMSLIEEYRMERERQQKLEEEEEIRRLRKELVPRAQPMPYFDRPFIPRRSERHPTVPKEPRFHIPHHKKIKCCMSWNDIYSTQQ